MDEPIDVVLSNSLSNAFCTFDVDVLQREVPTWSVRWGRKMVIHSHSLT